MGYIYRIINKINNKSYIGQTLQTIERRFSQHVSSSKRFKNGNKRTCFVLYKAMRKYGVENFYIELLEECDNKNLDKREKYWIQHYKTFKEGYNATIGGNGKPHIDETKIIKDLKTGNFTREELSKKYNCSLDRVTRIKSRNKIKTKYKKTLSSFVMVSSKNGENLYKFDKIEDVIAFYVLCFNFAPKTPKNIIKAVRTRKLCYGFLWKKTDENLKIDNKNNEYIKKQAVFREKIYNNSQEKKIIQKINKKNNAKKSCENQWYRKNYIYIYFHKRS